MNFRQNFSQKKKFLSPFQKRTLAETVNCIPKGLRKGNPFQGPFAQLSYTFQRTKVTILEKVKATFIHFPTFLLGPYGWEFRIQAHRHSGRKEHQVGGLPANMMKNAMGNSTKIGSSNAYIIMINYD